MQRERLQEAPARSRTVNRTPPFIPAHTPYADARPWRGESVGAEPADVALFGAPLDLTESFRTGAAGGPAAVREMSLSLESYSPAIGRDVQDLALLDLGDLPLQDASMEDALALIAAGMQTAAGSGRLGIMIGGEHTVSLGAFRGVKRLYPDAILLQLDAHLDIREEYEGRAITHASWAFHAGTESGFDRVVQLGVRSGAREEWPVAQDRTAYSGEDLLPPPSVLSRLASCPIYLTVDIDVLDPGAAPGTGCPEPGGPSFREVVRALRTMSELRVVGMDVVEVAPRLDPSGITAVAAAKIIRESILLFAAGRRLKGPAS